MVFIINYGQAYQSSIFTGELQLKNLQNTGSQIKSKSTLVKKQEAGPKSC